MSPINTPPDEQSSRQLDKKIIALFLIPSVVFAVISCLEGLNDQQIADLLEIFNFSKFGAPVNGAIITFLLLLFILFAFSPSIRWTQKLLSALTGKYFVISLAVLAVLGAGAALYIPSYTSLFKTDTQHSTSGTQTTQNGQASGNQQNQSSKDPSSDLRLHLLYITGGVIAVLGLIETNRKNSQDHIRQVHAARRERYIEAVDKLSSEQVPVRLGGVYALAGLIDEWLSDENINKNIRVKEGQVIINNLCAYIRSPFELAEKREIIEGSSKMNVYSGNLSEDKAKLQEEQEIRRTIFTEISERSSSLKPNSNGDLSITHGDWSEFDFNFSRAPIFYSLNNLTIEKGIFTSAEFYGNADFNGSTFIRSSTFKGTHFTQEANFNEVTFNGKADFSAQGDTQTTFEGKATFNGAQFIQGANFNEVTFNEAADFSTQGDAETVFGGKATFNSTQFKKTALFNKTIFNETDFSGSTMNKTIFTMDAIFEGTEFTKNTSFNNVKFSGLADFSSHSQNLIQPITFGGNTEFIGTDFHGKANFMGVIAELDSVLSSDTPSLIFKKVNFEKEAIFTSAQINLNTVFDNTHFHNSAEFEHTNFYDSVKFIGRTNFNLQAKFIDSKFLKNLEVEAWFKNGANFGMSQFGTENETQQKTTFRKTHFDGDAIFSGSNFYGPADFIEINSLGATDFSGVNFYSKVSFDNSNDRTMYIKFTGKAIYHKANFFKTADFISIRFCNEAIFANASFYEDSKFQDIYFDNFSPEFKDAEFETKSNHSFTTKSNSNKQFNFGSVTPNSTGQPISLPRGSFLFTDTPGNQRIGPA